MLFSLDSSHYSVENHDELRCWYSDNGLLYSQLVGPALVDTVAGTVTVHRRVPVAGQESRDFPEFGVDANGRPVTVEQVVDLVVMPSVWMLTMTGAWPELGQRSRSQEHALSLR